MSVTMRPTITCDRCGRSWPGQEGQNAFDLRIDLIRLGWGGEVGEGSHRKKDYCPDCIIRGRHPAGKGE